MHGLPTRASLDRTGPRAQLADIGIGCAALMVKIQSQRSAPSLESAHDVSAASEVPPTWRDVASSRRPLPDHPAGRDRSVDSPRDAVARAGGPSPLSPDPADPTEGRGRSAVPRAAIAGAAAADPPGDRHVRPGVRLGPGPVSVVVDGARVARSAVIGRCPGRAPIQGVRGARSAARRRDRRCVRPSRCLPPHR